MKKQIYNQKGNCGVFLLICGFLFAIGSLVVFEITMKHALNYLVSQNQKEVQIEKEVRHNGIETVALVVDKNIQKHNANPRSYNEYELTLYSLKETFHKTVSQKEFDAIPTNTYLQVVVKDDTILLGNKKDKEDTIRFNEVKELNINE